MSDAVSDTDLKNRLKKMEKAFVEKFDKPPTVFVRAPGRVNLIGEHTDYNEGFVFPCAIDREMIVAASLNESGVVSAYSLDYDESTLFPVGHIAHSTEQPWTNYLRGVVDVVGRQVREIDGLNLVTSGNVPQGAGLSSSAAFEVALVSVIDVLYGLNLNKTAVALLAQKAENEFVGVQCGIMDQFVSAHGKKDAAIFIDCRSLEHKAVRLNLEANGYSIVITHSGVNRGLVNSEYNARRAECAEGVRTLAEITGRHLSSLRDISIGELNEHQDRLSDKVFRRCHHVISENARVTAAVDALEKGDIGHFGELMNASHLSLKNDFEVSVEQIDHLVQLTQAHKTVKGARLTGAGFGGCTVAIMETAGIDSYRREVIAPYEMHTGKKTAVYVCTAEAGVTSLS